MKIRCFLLLTVLCVALTANTQAPAQPAPGQAPAAGQEQQKKQITDPAEHNAYVAIFSETDPGRRLKLLDDFLAKFPNTVMKEEALEFKMVAMLQVGQNPDLVARQLLQVNPNSLRALILVANIFNQTPLAETDPAFNQKLTEAEQIAQRGLRQLPNFQPANVSAEDLDKTRKGAESTFRQTVGIVAMGRKQYDQAQTEFRRAAETAPEDAALFYRLGNAYILQRPNPKYSEALWAFARAAMLEGPTALPPAGRQQVNAYLEKVYTQYHGSKEGLDPLKQQAKAQSFPPPDFKVMSKAEVVAAAPVEPEKLRFDEMRDLLVQGGPKSDELWGKLKGMPLRLKGYVVSATPAARPRTVRLIVLEETAKKSGDNYDIELGLGAPGRATPGKLVEFEGLVNSFNKDPFSMTLVDGKITGGEGAGPQPGAKKAGPAGKKRAAKKR